MSQATAPANRRLGEYLEEFAMEQLGDAERVSAASHDLETDDGEWWESKGCQLSVSDGRYQRAGRFWIARKHHERLIEADGHYALTVHDDGEVVEFRTISAQEMDEMIYSWTNVGSVTRNSAEESTQVPHTRVFPELQDQVGDRE